MPAGTLATCVRDAEGGSGRIVASLRVSDCVVAIGRAADRDQGDVILKAGPGTADSEESDAGAGPPMPAWSTGRSRARPGEAGRREEDGADVTAIGCAGPAGCRLRLVACLGLPALLARGRSDRWRGRTRPGGAG